MSRIAHDIRYAFRSLRRSPGFTLIAVLTLSLGIGATAAIFTVANSVVLEPLRYPDAGRLVHIAHPVPGENPDWTWGVSEAGFFYFLEHNRTFQDIGVYESTQLGLAGGDRAEPVRTAMVSANLFSVLGARPAAGRLLVTEDNRAENAPLSAVVLGYDFWRTRFGADPGIIGGTVRIEGMPAEVVGVAEPGFHLPGELTDLWLPVAIDPANRPVNWHRFSAVGRLRDGVTLEAATADLERLKAQFPEALPQAYDPGFMESTQFAVAVEPLRSKIVGDFDRLLWVLLAAVGMVLLIACANVANLFLVRMEARRREVAIRTAIGASTRDLAARYLTEGLLLAVLAGVLALALAYVGIQQLLQYGPDNVPRLWDISLGWKSVGFTLGLALLTGVVFGLFPVLRGTPDFTELRHGGRSVTASRGQHTLRSTLVVGEIALAVVLLAGAGLMLRTFQNLRSIEPGFDPRGVLTVEMALPAANYRSQDEIGSFYHQLTSELAALPGVTAVGATSALPLRSGSGCSLVFTDDPAAEERNRSCFAQPVRVTPGYFAAMGISVHGREPAWSEVLNRSGEAVISRAAADHLWPGEDPIGKGIKGNGSNPPFYRIVGVADYLRAEALDKPAVPQVYFPMLAIEGAQLWGAPLAMTLALRTAAGQPESLAPTVRQLIAGMDPQISIGRIGSMERVVAESVARTAFTMLLLGISAGVALLLGIVGLYGVVSYIVAQRTAEIGIRLALGARIEQVAGMVVLHAGKLAAGGVVFGVVAALAATRVLRSLLFEVSPTDPWVLGTVSLLLFAVALLAAYLPARRATRVDPMTALRAE